MRTIQQGLYPSQWAWIWNMLVAQAGADPLERSAFVTFMEFGGQDYYFKGIGGRWHLLTPRGGPIRLVADTEGEGRQQIVGAVELQLREFNYGEIAV